LTVVAELTKTAGTPYRVACHHARSAAGASTASTANGANAARSEEPAHDRDA
jgi:hypothetical protein